MLASVGIEATYKLTYLLTYIENAITDTTVYRPKFMMRQHETSSWNEEKNLQRSFVSHPHVLLYNVTGALRGCLAVSFDSCNNV